MAEKPDTTTAAPNSTTGPAEVSGIVPDTKSEEKMTQNKSAPDEKTEILAEMPSSRLPGALQELALALPDLIETTGHSEVWGVKLTSPETSIPTQIVLQKYLNANDGIVDRAKTQLKATLEWRAKMKPLELLHRKFNTSKFGGLGYVTIYSTKGKPETKEVFTWNIYGSVRNIDETFGNLDEFIAWRVALMELALAELNISAATTPITSTDRLDPYKITQVHDYKSLSFFSQSALVKTASKKTIEVFSQNYPELLKEKFFVNVPAIMGFMYALMKMFVAEETRKKFHPMANGAGLAKEFGASAIEGLERMMPKEYGGQGEGLKVVGKAPVME